MPKILPSPSTVVLLWVKQGKTDHMAQLVDPDVLSKLEERRESSSSSFSMSSLSVSDLVPDATSEVAVRWSSTNQRDFVEASTIRFRDLESEGRPSRRRGGQSSSSGIPPPAAAAPERKKVRNTKKSKNASEGRSSVSIITKNDLAPPAKKRRKALNRKGAGQQAANTTIESADTSTNSSIVTKEGRDDDLLSLEQRSIDSKSLPLDQRSIDSKSLTGSGIDTIGKNQHRSIDNSNAIAKAASVEDASSTQKISETNCRKQISSPQNQNVIDIEDEDFDSSDDEAVVFRMKMKHRRNGAKIEQKEKLSTSPNDAIVATEDFGSFRNQHSAAKKVAARNKINKKDSSKPNDDSTAASSDNIRKIARRKRKRLTIPPDSESDHDCFYSGSKSDSCSAPTEASSRRGERRYPNGYDSQDDDDDTETPADDGQTNTSNWRKMKLFFRGKNWV